MDNRTPEEGLEGKDTRVETATEDQTSSPRSEELENDSYEDAPVNSNSIIARVAPGPKGRRFGRPISFIWEVFTTENEPWKLRESTCLHCKKVVSYHKKSEYVLVHLNRCAAFLKFCKEENKMELMYFVIRHMEEASRVKRLRRRNGKSDRKEVQAGYSKPPADKAWLLIDLVTSSPAPDCIPVKLLHESAHELLVANKEASEMGSMLFEKTCNEFTSALSPFLKKCMGRTNVNPHSVVPVVGVAEALHVISSVQLKRNNYKPGGFVYVEERTDVRLCDVFLERGFTIKTVASDRHGVVVEDLRAQLLAYDHDKNEPNRKDTEFEPWPVFLYLMPSFNNPTGICLSPSRRIELLELTSAANLLVVADDSLALLDFSWEVKMLQVKDRHKVYGHYPGAVNPIAALGADKVHELRSLIDFSEFTNVVSVSSFAYVITPELRVGWIECNDSELFQLLKTMVTQISGGGLSPFSACIVAQCLKKDHTNPADVVAANIMKEPDLYRHVCDIKNSYANRYHHLTSALIRFSNMLLPPGDLNQIRIEGFSDYPDGHVDNVFQVVPVATALQNVGSPTSTGSGSSSWRSSEVTPRWKNRTGGYFIWVKLPVWVRPRPVQPYYPAPAYPIDPNLAGPSTNQAYYLVDPAQPQPPVGPHSLQWFLEKARNEFNLDIKLDIECTPMGLAVTYTTFVPQPTYSEEGQVGGGNAARVTCGPCGTGSRFVRMCFVRYDESTLEEAAERFISLLAKVYAECAQASSYGYSF